MSLFPAGMIGGSLPVCAVTYHAAPVSTANALSYTFSAQPFTPGRHAVVTLNVRGSATLTSVTVDGVNCTLAKAQGGSNTSILISDTPVNNSSVDVVVTFASGSPANCGIGLYSVSGLQSTTPVDTDGTSLDNTAISLNVTAGGFMIGSAYNVQTSGVTFTWTNITEDFDHAVESASASNSGAHDLTPTTTAISLTCDVANPNAQQIAYASFR